MKQKVTDMIRETGNSTIIAGDFNNRTTRQEDQQGNKKLEHYKPTKSNIHPTLHTTVE